MTSDDIINGIKDIAATTLPATGDTTPDQRAAFSNQVVIYITDSVNPDNTAKPNIRF